MTDVSRRSFLAAAASLAATSAMMPPLSPPDADELRARGDDPLGLRRDFPIVGRQTFLNSAYIAPIPRQVVAAGQAFLEEKASHSFQLGPLFRKTEEVRGQFARLINAATPDEVGLLFSTAEGENVVAQGLRLTAGDNIVISELHYDTEFVLYGMLQKERGVELRIARHRDGAVEPRDFEPLVDRKTKLVSVAWVSHRNGYRHDMKGIAEVAHAKGALVYVDAIQGLGTFPMDVQASDIDFLCAGSYKWLLAGWGVAPLYVRSAVADRLTIDRYGEMHAGKELPDHSYEIPTNARRFDYSSRAFGDLYTLSAGLSYLERVGIERIERHTIDGLAQRLQQGLAAQGHRLFTPLGNRSAIVTFYTTKEQAQVQAAFQAANVNVTVRNGMVRVSAALFNNTDDIDRCLDVTRRLV
ncbi:MAG TPA: aminotransferase class V-fold PLP-dependent enzyme [Gemmatimonadales bacterium]|nr:aminotransferase class V-fold PLP-dependent enzyme [Gemmatimonadales bacterium]